MKITKENFMKLFVDGLSKMENMDSLHSLSLSTDSFEGGTGINMSYHIRSQYDVLGIIQLHTLNNSIEFFENIDFLEDWQSFGVKYFLTFTSYSDRANHYDTYSSNSKHKQNKEKFEQELSSAEFVKLAKVFKNRFDEIRKHNADMRNDDINRKLETLSDEYGLDFFPKKRKVITEKTKEIVEYSKAQNTVAVDARPH